MILTVHLPQRFTTRQKQAVMSRYGTLCRDFPRTTEEIRIDYADSDDPGQHGIRIVGGDSQVAGWLWDQLTDAARNQ